MAVTISLYNQTTKLFANKQVNLANTRLELLNSSASFVASHTTKNQVDNGSTATITMTIASPAVVSHTSHGYSAGQPVVFTTTGSLPSGVTPGQTYYVIAAGLTANAYQFSATAGGAAVNTTGSQSGVHTVFGDGSYQFYGNGWPAGGPTVAGVTVSTVTTNDAALTATDVVVTAAGGSIGPSTAAAWYDSLTGLVLAYIDFGGSQSAGDTTDFKIRWNAAGILSWTY